MFAHIFGSGPCPCGAHTPQHMHHRHLHTYCNTVLQTDCPLTSMKQTSSKRQRILCLSGHSLPSSEHLFLSGRMWRRIRTLRRSAYTRLCSFAISYSEDLRRLTCQSDGSHIIYEQGNLVADVSVLTKSRMQCPAQTLKARGDL